MHFNISRGSYWFLVLQIDIIITYFRISFFQPKIVETLIGEKVIKVSCGAMHVMAITGIYFLF